MLNTASLRTWFVLRALRGLGDATICRLVQAFGSPEAVLAASAAELLTLGGLSNSLAQAVQQGLDRDTQQEIDRELKALERLGLSVVTYLEASYPPRLRMIHDPPPLLYVCGGLSEADRHAVALRLCGEPLRQAANPERLR